LSSHSEIERLKEELLIRKKKKDEIDKKYKPLVEMITETIEKDALDFGLFTELFLRSQEEKNIKK
jgi:hypothetical protein